MKLLFFFFFLILLYNTVLVLPYINMNPPWVYTCSQCSHEIKRHLLLERKAMTNLDSYYKAETLLCGQRSIHIVKPLVFRVVVYGCESWTVKSVEHWITDCFELWCWRRLLRVPLTGRRSNQATLKKINLEYSLEELMLKLKLPMLWPPDGKSQLIGKDPEAGKDWRQKEKRATGWDSWIGITDSIDVNLGKL